jgi:hypothetical protein
MKQLINPYLAPLLLYMTAKAAAAGQLVDPTRPPQAQAISSPQPEHAVRVEAVLYSADRNFAIVNGKVVRAGDHIGTAQVEAILPDGVRYVRDGRTHVARLQQAAVRVRHSVVQSGTGR